MTTQTIQAGNIADQPAFPGTVEFDKRGDKGDWVKAVKFHPGMTMRQYYAGQAMQALLSDVETQRWVQTDPRFNGENFSQAIALNAVDFADALIEELSKPLKP